GKGYQIVQGMFAIGDGGLGGAGLGQGHPTLIPAVQNDFIFAGIAEELGLFGATAILMSFMLIVGAGLRVAVRAERPFEKLLATGLTALLGVQAFIIIGGVIRVVPLTGITLPFVSYGGSSLVANYVLLALLIRVSDSTSRRIGELPDDPTINERFAAWRLRRRLRKQVGAVPGDDTTYAASGTRQ
ncbi:MAG: putative FtsW/RodA/SpoVE family cell cycle protein, partial [Acidimicrobiales bacterium]|nr:putative FtsW/RodA/SpoVE family cell cycle protein [Acidimicrobiales bacterium]